MTTKIGLILFLLFIGLAMFLYPGSSEYNLDSVGFQLHLNFWSDLLEEKAYNGQINNGLIYAKIALSSLGISLIPFWIKVPKVFNYSPVWAYKTVQIFGVLGAICIAIVHTFFYKYIIMYGAPISSFALFAFVYGLLKAKNYKILSYVLITGFLVCLNYLQWFLEISHEYLPVTQKITTFSFLILLWVTNREIHQRR